MKKLLRNRGLIERGGVLLERGGFQIALSFFLQNSMFLLLLEYFFSFFCPVDIIHDCSNQ